VRNLYGLSHRRYEGGTGWEKLSKGMVGRKLWDEQQKPRGKVGGEKEDPRGMGLGSKIREGAGRNR
jgi:hypothetical protein